jgi:hypothetical protein
MYNWKTSRKSGTVCRQFHAAIFAYLKSNPPTFLAPESAKVNARAHLQRQSQQVESAVVAESVG